MHKPLKTTIQEIFFWGIKWVKKLNMIWINNLLSLFEVNWVPVRKYQLFKAGELPKKVETNQSIKQ